MIILYEKPPRDAPSVFIGIKVFPTTVRRCRRDPGVLSKCLLLSNKILRIIDYILELQR